MWPMHDQLLSAELVYNFCKSSISGITRLFFIAQTELDPIRALLELLYAAGSTISGTRSFHHFTPKCRHTIKSKQVSEDTTHYGMHCFFKPPVLLHNDIPLMTYVACVHDNQWWIGLVSENTSGKGDVCISFFFTPMGNLFLLTLQRRQVLGSIGPCAM